MGYTGALIWLNTFSVFVFHFTLGFKKEMCESMVFYFVLRKIIISFCIYRRINHFVKTYREGMYILPSDSWQLDSSRACFHMYVHNPHTNSKSCRDHTHQLLRKPIKPIIYQAKCCPALFSQCIFEMHFE